MSPRLRILRLIWLLGVVVCVGLVLLAAAVTAWVAAGRNAGIPVVAGAALLCASTILLGWWLIGRNYTSWGYAEREDDLLVRHGWLFRRLVVVPYGRMQFVDVTAGPLERKLGLATVQLHTAAAATDATIPGLPPEEAARLRDRLAALGEARSAGL